ncbi:MULTISPECIES: oxidoreductase [unclassified Sphingomonas]|uniref:oxidoreductase n=1 Tax=unclassified Sphingomonas TaxID=196159 RepID=UPI00226A4352|nr:MULTISPECIES: oxidoreductase [unclassified Sphingomonas]
MNDPLRVGLLGYGFSGKTFHAPLIAASDRLMLCAVASRDAAKVHADLPGIRVDADPLAIIRSPDIDLIVIATPNEAHAPLALAAIEAGKHVVIDKPFALDLAEARSVVAAATRADRQLSVFHNRRWDSDFLTVRDAIAAGMIGDIVHFESHLDRFRPEVRDRWRERAGPGSGVWFDLGPHLVDQALQLFGLPDLIQASLACQRPGAVTDDWAHVILFYGQRRVILHAGMLVAGGTHRFVAHGTEGSFVKRLPDRQEALLLDGTKPGAEGWGADPDGLTIYRHGTERTIPATPGDQRRFYDRLATSLRGAGAAPVPPIEALAVMAVVEAASLSSRERRAVELPLTAEERAAWR